MEIANYKHEWEDQKYGNQFAGTAIVCKDSEVKNSAMGEYSRLKPYSELRNSTVGDYSILSSYSIINATDMGKFNSIGPGVFIGLWEHNQWVSTHSFYLSEACGGFVKGFGAYEKDHVRTKLGHDVWVGAGAIVKKGVTVGNGAIIGAGSIVTKDVPDYGVVVGNPARVKRYRFNEDDRTYLLKLRWWDFDREVLQKMIEAQVWSSVEDIKKFCKNENLVDQHA